MGGYSGRISHIVCGVDTGLEGSPRGLLAVLSLASSKIVRAFSFPDPVVQVCMVSGGNQWVDPCTLHSVLRLAAPLIVVATKHLSLHLLDLALDVTGMKTDFMDINCILLARYFGMHFIVCLLTIIFLFICSLN